MAELKNSEPESKTPDKPDADKESARVSPNVEANQKMFAESASIARNNVIEKGSESDFDKSRRSSAAMAEHGDIPSLQIDENKDKTGPNLSDDDLKEMREGMVDAKAKTKGWDSFTPPPVLELKEKIGDSNVLFWGDDHMDKDSPERFKNALDSLKKSGIDTVAMEGFREDQQGLVNNWLAAKKGSGEDKKLEAQLREYLDKALNSGPEFSNKIMDLMKGIKDAGMKVLCIEPNGGQITYDGDGEEEKDRDGNWQNVVQNHLKENPESKVLIFAGSGHFIHMRDETVADRMAKDGTKTTDITPPSQYIDGEIILAK